MQSAYRCAVVAPILKTTDMLPTIMQPLFYSLPPQFANPFTLKHLEKLPIVTESVSLGHVHFKNHSPWCLLS